MNRKLSDVKVRQSPMDPSESAPSMLNPLLCFGKDPDGVNIGVNFHLGGDVVETATQLIRLADHLLHERHRV